MILTNIKINSVKKESNITINLLVIDSNDIRFHPNLIKYEDFSNIVLFLITDIVNNGILIYDLTCYWHIRHIRYLILYAYILKQITTVYLFPMIKIKIKIKFTFLLVENTCNIRIRYQSNYTFFIWCKRILWLLPS